MILHCQQCKEPIAAFDELRHPITPDQFKPYRTDRPLPRWFGGEKGIAVTFMCPRCRRWPFVCQENWVLDQAGRKCGIKEPDRVLIGIDKGFQWYDIPGTEPKSDEDSETKCVCGHKTEYPKLMTRHKKGCKEWKAQQNK